MRDSDTAALAHDTRELQLRIRALKRKRPGMGLPVNMIVFGSAAVVLGAVGIAAVATDDEPGGPGLVAFPVIAAAGIGLDIGGIMLLRKRRAERQRINLQIYRLKQQYRGVRGAYRRSQNR